MFSQNCTLEIFITPSTISVLSPSIDKYLGWFTLVLFHTTFESDEFGFLKSNQIKCVHKTLLTAPIYNKLYILAGLNHQFNGRVHLSYIPSFCKIAPQLAHCSAHSVFRCISFG